MEYFDNILCIDGAEMIVSEVNPDGLMPSGTYKSLVTRRQIRVLRRGGNGRTALVEYASLPYKYRKLYEGRFGKPERRAELLPLERRLTFDTSAQNYYSEVMGPDGERLADAHPDMVKRLTNCATVLNALSEYIAEKAGLRRSKGLRTPKPQLWEHLAAAVHSEAVQTMFPHNLPKNAKSLMRKYKTYIQEGYSSLIHKGYGNDNSRVMSEALERLAMSIYCLPTKPFGAEAYSIYKEFMEGRYEIFDKSTGELYDRSTFYKNGKPVIVSERTFTRYLNMPQNRIAVDSLRNDVDYNKRVHEPHMHRRRGIFSYSKVSMDDRDLPRKMQGGGYCKAYYAYDVVSGCVIGAAYSKKKDAELVTECFRDMFRQIFAAGAPMPGELELEHHLMHERKDELEIMFPFVHWCVPGNSQEKEAEHENRAKKYGVEKKAHPGIGRWWARSEAYRIKVKKNHNEWVEREFSFETLVAEDRADIEEFNNQLHPRQKTYPGMTRRQVLELRRNPNLEIPGEGRKAMICRYIGYETKTTIRRTMYAKVKGLSFRLSSPEVVAKLSPYDKTVTAYWLDDAAGNINEVYIFQNDKFIDKAAQIAPFNSARVEWEEADEQSYREQGAYISEYRGMVREKKRDIARLAFIDAERLARVAAQKAEVVPAPPQPEQPQQQEEEEDMPWKSFDAAKYRAMAKASLV